MKAAVLEGVGKLVLKEVSTPKPGFGEAVVQVRSCGICQTDYKAFTGERTNWNPPMIPGHEMSGVVAEVGQGISYFKESDEVIVAPVAFCGLCDPCRSGMQHYCENGAVIGGDGFETVWDGGFAEYVKAPVGAIYHKPKSVSFDAAALAEPLAGSYKGLIEYTQMRVGEDVVIIGAGSMGLLLTQIAYAAGAGTLILIDIDDYKEEFALKCGAHYFINSSKEEPRKRVYEILPKGPEIVFEAAGPIPAAELAYSLCRRGTRINMFGVTTPGTIEVSPAQIHFKEIRTDASFSVNSKVMLKSVMLMEKKLVDPTKIITHHFPLDQINQAFQKMGTAHRVKIMIHP